MEEQNWLLYIAAFATAFGVAIFTAPYVKKVAERWGAIDYPKRRSLHKEPVPRMGGLAIVFGFAATMIIMAPFVYEIMSMQFLGFAIGAVIIVILGILDDIYQLKSKTKLLVQMVAALIVVFTGTRMSLDFLPLNFFASDMNAVSIIITFVWIVGITNAVNLIDGVDGLAAGVSSICAICLVILCIMAINPYAVVLTAAIAGGCLGFLPRNFSPSEIIMGDTGALFLGFSLATMSIMGVFKSYALFSIVIAVLVLALPIFDTLFAMIRRYVQGKPIMQADRGHLHHRLIDAGLSHRSTVILLYGLSALCGAVAILIALRDIRAISVLIVLVVVMVSMVSVYRKRM